jgi:HPt (histidine-containing phosphotransfer) domain-containing protein
MTIELCISDFENGFNKLKKAIEAGDAGKVSLYAHSIKGVAANVSANRLKSSAFDLEMAGKNGETGKWESLFEVMKDRFIEFKDEALKHM